MVYFFAHRAAKNLENTAFLTIKFLLHRYRDFANAPTLRVCKGQEIFTKRILQ